MNVEFLVLNYKKAELTPYHVEARYGDYKEKLSEIIDGQKAQKVYRKTLEIHKWLYQKTR